MPTVLEGTWKTASKVSPWYFHRVGKRQVKIDVKSWVIESLSVSDTTLVWKWNEYQDENAEINHSLWTDTYSSLTLGDKVAATEEFPNGYRKFTLNVDSYEGTLQSERAVTEYNNWNFGGSSEYVLNRSFDYSGKTGFSAILTDDSVEFPVKNTSLSGYYYLDGNNLQITISGVDYGKHSWDLIFSKVT